MPCHEPTRRDIDHWVKDAAENALTNGYGHWESIEALAIDMATCDCDMEKLEIGVIVESITRQRLLKKVPSGYVITID